VSSPSSLSIITCNTNHLHYDFSISQHPFRFTGVVKLRSFTLIGGEEGKSPGKLKAFINREDIDFSVADTTTPTQEWELAEDYNGEIAYPAKYDYTTNDTTCDLSSLTNEALPFSSRIHKFQNVSSLTLYIPENFGAPESRIYYLGLKGEFTPVSPKAPPPLFLAT
jgi:hypothetical protein